MWERTLQDLIRGLRSNKKDEAKFIAKAVDEIRKEIKSDDMELKAGAVLKLTYLDMLGYDMSWASFHVVEVMSSPRFHIKSVGYLAAVQSFDQETDVLMLTTNLLKKDLTSTPADVAVTLDGLAHIVSPDLARDLSPELIAMLTHSRPNIRKRAILALYKVFMKYPAAALNGMGRLRDRLEDSDPGVVAATVNVLCELAQQSPQDYLPLAPQLFHLLTTSSNNWMLIKIIKLFGSLSPHEPRLVKKLQGPITELISTTPAISLLYECVHTCIIGGMLNGTSGDALARMCVSKLAAFIEDVDQNLKYIALLALVKIVPSHPHLVAEYQETILASINDQDISIRMRALDLLSAMVNRQNLQSIVQQLLSHLVPETSSMLPTAAQSLAQNSTATTAKPQMSPNQYPAYRLVLAQRILSICSHSTYENVTNFEWYLSVLVDLSHVANVDVGAQIRDQLVDVVGRVRGTRRYAVKLMHTLLTDNNLLHNANDEGSCAEVLWSAAWICGEFPSELAEPQKLIPSLLRPEIRNLDPETIAVYLQSAMKIFGFWASELAQRWDDEDLEETKSIVESVIERVDDLASSSSIEVQERAANILGLFSFIQADLASHRAKPVAVDPIYGNFSDAGPSDVNTSSEPRFPKSLYLIRPLFSGHELNPVAQAAQSSVPVPNGLNLDAWIVPPPKEPEEESTPKVKKSRKGKEKESNGVKHKSTKKKETHQSDFEETKPAALVELEETPEQEAERERRKAERLERNRDDPYYIFDPQDRKPIEDIESIPIVRLEDMPSLPPPEDPRLPSLREFHQSSAVVHTIDRDGEMPPGAKSPPYVPISGHHTPIPDPSPMGTPRISSFPEYDEGPSTPEPIQVVRTKKKSKGLGKKKRIT